METEAQKQFKRVAAKMVAEAYKRPNGPGRPRGLSQPEWEMLLAEAMTTTYCAGVDAGVAAANAAHEAAR